MSWEDYVSIHGICFDEGQSGNCGIECRGFLNGECDVASELIENCKEELLQKKFGGELGIAVIRAQTKYEFDEQAELDKIMEEEYGYK